MLKRFRIGGTSNQPPAKDAATPSERRAKHIYQILLIISLVFNGYLAVRAQLNTERQNELNAQKTGLEATKTDLENQLLQAKNRPTFSFYRLRYELGTFDSQLKQGKLIPFLNNPKDHRIVQNTVFNAMEQGLASLKRGRHSRAAVTFLVVANAGSAPAYSIKALAGDSAALELGDLMPEGVLLIPTLYQPADASQKSEASPEISSLRFESSLGTRKQFNDIPVPPPVAQSWVPLLENVRGIGRALVTDSDEHIGNVLPPTPR